MSGLVIIFTVSFFISLKKRTSANLE
jgi:hypothetical protein